MTKDEALRLALEALERSVATCLDPYSHEQVMSRPEHFINKAITALRLAIDVQSMASKSTYKEQLETKYEPVAWEQFHEHMAGPNYVAPQSTWVGLTDEDKQKLVAEHHDWESLYFAIQAKLKERNT
jgi:hypothetical protein